MSSNTETPTSLRDEYESSPVLYRLNETQNDTNEKINFESIQSQNTANKISLFFQQDSIGHSTPTPSNPSNTQALLKSEQKLSVVGRTSIFRTVEQLLLVLKENGLKELNEQKLLSLFTKDEMHRLLSTKGSYIPKSTSKPSMTHTLLRSIGRGLFEKEFSKLFEEFPILPDCKDHKPGFLDGAELTFLNCDDSKWQMANEGKLV